MKKVLVVLMLFVIVLTIGSTAQATRTWVSGNTGNWSSTANWGGTLPSTQTAQIDNGNVTVDSAQVTAQLLMGVAATTGTAVLNVSGGSLNVSKSSAELFSLVKTSNAAQSTTINQSAGTVSVYSTGYAGTGETRLVSSSTTAGTAIYNLSGGVLDTEILSKGNKLNAAAQFNATGGTLVLRNMIYRFGRAAEGAGAGFNQGQAKLEIGAIGTVATVNVGNATNAMDYTVGTGGTMVFDIASATSYDKLYQYVDATITTNINYANTAGATLQINLGYTPTVGDYYDVWTFNGLNGVGSGAFAVVPAGFSANWIDTNSDGNTDTLRLTVIPEPATIALLSIGLLAIRRNRK
jgi:hypothetical protein